MQIRFVARVLLEIAEHCNDHGESGETLATIDHGFLTPALGDKDDPPEEVSPISGCPVRSQAARGKQIIDQLVDVCARPPIWPLQIGKDKCKTR